MKLRIRGNSVRVRVTKTEAARLGAGDKVEQITEFPSNQLISSVEPSDACESVTADFHGPHLRIILPTARAKAWAASDAVSIEADQTLANGTTLQILVEKDFECRHSKTEENADAFPNPRGG